LQLFNSLSRSLEEFLPADASIAVYVCGITPYDTTHLGHAFTYTCADLLIRYLEYRGHPVRYVQNVTDIDDDILRAAERAGEDWQGLGNRWTAHFMRDMGALNVRYLLTDKLNDLWIDNAYYDMNFTTTVVPGRRVDLVPPRPFEATGLGIVSFVVEGYLSPQGEQVAQVTVEGDDGRRERFILRFGVDTAQGDLEVPELRHQPARIASPWRTREQAFHYIATLPLKAPLTVRRIEVIGLLNRGVWHVRALSLTDQRTGASVPVPLDGRFSQAASGDLKLYRLETEQPRVSIERAYRVEPDSGRALGALEQRGGPVLLEEPPAWSKAERPGGVLQDGIEALEWTPERIVLRASVRSPALLYLRETHFPGWRVWVDGEEGKMLLANGIFRAVALSAGSHTVEFRYEPVTLRMGVQLSLTSLMVVGSLVVVALATLWWRADASL